MQRNEAPGELELVRRFVNTRDIEEGSDELHSTDALLSWFAGMDLLNEDGATADEKDLERALALREGLRALLLANNGKRSNRPTSASSTVQLGACVLRSVSMTTAAQHSSPNRLVYPQPLVASLPRWCGPRTRGHGAG